MLLALAESAKATHHPLTVVVQVGDAVHRATLAAPSALKARTETLGPVSSQRNPLRFEVVARAGTRRRATRKGGSNVHRWRRSCGDHHHHPADLAALTGVRVRLGGNGSDDDRDSDD